ncbi:MAG: YhbY family RNA-binding protein, partial [Candidatus Thermoplasmatota archaeon]|nr:YhbY family RNA-binding protein [Candidatus Thermoplasmatota archaeon]
MKIPEWVILSAKDPDLKSTVRLGRNGLTASIIKEIETQLSARSLVKIRLNRGFAVDSEQRKEIF